MKRFLADLHVHSLYSRATSKQSDLAGLSAWAMLKGIEVIGTGDFTHPVWLAQLKRQLVEAEPGLFRLRDQKIPSALSAEVQVKSTTRFMLSSEISCIYRQAGKTRKVHLILYVPDFASADRICQRLDSIGNLHADGRPILGLSARDLLAILLESSDQGFMVPAHIWTPWFSLFGAKSGFDQIEECFGDLSDQIFALETGLSADPEMIRRISALDRFTLVSNSDCHSPSKLGREATLFETELDFFSIRQALKKPSTGFGGTVEYFPEEGKYYWDGHRKCGVTMNPQKNDGKDQICPICQKPVTMGVLRRVMDLADRHEPIYPKGQNRFYRLLPLVDLLAEICQVGPMSKTVMKEYRRTIALFGSELQLLLEWDPEEIAARHSTLLGEAVKRIRSGKVTLIPGFDGEYGKVRLFDDLEL